MENSDGSYDDGYNAAVDDVVAIIGEGGLVAGVDPEQPAPVVKVYARVKRELGSYQNIEAGATLEIPIGAAINIYNAADVTDALTRLMTNIAMRAGEQAVQAYFSRLAEPVEEYSKPQVKTGAGSASPTPAPVSVPVDDDGNPLPGNPAKYGGGWLGRLLSMPNKGQLKYGDQWDVYVDNVFVEGADVVFKLATARYQNEVSMRRSYGATSDLLAKIFGAVPAELGTREQPSALPSGTVLRCSASSPYVKGDGSVGGIILKTGNPFVNVSDVGQTDLDLNSWKADASIPAEAVRQTV